MKNLQRLGKTREREYLGYRLWQYATESSALFGMQSWSQIEL